MLTETPLHRTTLLITDVRERQNNLMCNINDIIVEVIARMEKAKYITWAIIDKTWGVIDKRWEVKDKIWEVIDKT